MHKENRCHSRQLIRKYCDNNAVMQVLIGMRPYIELLDQLKIEEEKEKFTGELCSLIVLMEEVNRVK